MTTPRLGIDIGALYIKAVAKNGSDRPITVYRTHQGNPVQALRESLAHLPQKAYLVGLTGSGASLLTEPLDKRPIHFIEAEIEAVRARFPQARNILNVGGGSCTIIHLDDRGKFLNYSANSLCAAGTGSFLDEQARRLGIDYADMAEFDYDGVPPSIASRCAVFAKSDLIHRQQEGYGKQAMWAGLCKGCVDTFLQTLLMGKPLQGATVVTGGVVLNRSIMKWLRTYFGDQVMTWEEGHLAGALGAAALAQGEPLDLQQLVDSDRNNGKGGSVKIKRSAPLVLERTSYPSFAVHTEYVDEHDTEIRLWRELSGTIAVTLGIDIGSTSTKLVLLDEHEQVVVDVYRKTQGDPLEAVRKLFVAMEQIMEQRNVRFAVTGCGTTGSGRKFIGQIVGADQVINEISAHVAGAMRVDPQIDTIFEIGGQDSKYMRTVGGVIRDANMNFICAAGTGSFVEERAAKLGYKVHEIGDAVIGIAPPETSDRCTVFMEEDTNKLLRLGFTREEALAAVLNSVVKNYLNRVVGNRYISDKKVFFQGATARNKGLVAAFEKQLGVQVVVSPLCHQMGAFGLALLIARHMRASGQPTAFRGFDLSRRRIELNKQSCDACNNTCSITVADIEGESGRPSWGYMCGKEPDETGRKKNSRFALFRKRDKLLRKELLTQQVPPGALRIGLPASLTVHTYLPFWTVLLNTLGYRVVLAPPTDEKTKERGVKSASGDFCFPVKVAIGHALEMVDRDDIDRILIPHAISAPPNEQTTNSLFCPYVQSHPSVVRSIMALNGIEDGRLLTPVMDQRWDDTRFLREFDRSLGSVLGVRKGAMKQALVKAFAAQQAFSDACRQEGRRALDDLARRGQKAVVVIGRPYNCHDAGSNLDLPEKISEYGTTVIPLDFVPFEPKRLGSQYANIYWNYGQRIIGALQTVAKSDNLFAIYLSNFNCGPDSFLLTYAERILGDKPLLILELDEHGADAGYMTRVEAFLDVVGKSRVTAPKSPAARPAVSLAELKKRTLWLPPMHPVVGPLMTAIFERFGYRAQTLPPEDREAFEIGCKAVRGSECLPTSVTIGGLLKKLREIDAVGSEHAFFMATATGPCRFGQYALLHRTILDRYGYQDVAILSPSSYNSYQGLEEKIRRELWWGFLVADVMFKMQCRVRPYEINVGETDHVMQQQIQRVSKVFVENGDLEGAIRQAASAFAAVERHDQPKPLVGIVGEIYVRCNPFSNGYLIDHIEGYGGEAWLAPLSEWLLYTAHLQEWSVKQNLRNVTARGKSLLKNRFLFSTEHKMYSWCDAVLADRHEPPIGDVVREGRRFMPINFEGEAIITVGRVVEFLRQGAALVVNCAPFGCMPGTLTSSIFQQIEKESGVPVISMYYDGEGEINRRLEVYLHQAGKQGDSPALLAGAEKSRPGREAS